MATAGIPGSELVEEKTEPEIQILEEIDDDEEVAAVLGLSEESVPNSRKSETLSLPLSSTNSSVLERNELCLPVTPPSSTEQGTKREFGNISPISELLDDDDIPSPEERQDGDGKSDDERSDDDVGKVTPEPGPHPMGRTSFPRLSDGRSSPILAYSPSLLKSPSSNGSNKSCHSNSPAASNDRIQKRPRNIARMLDNISDHSSGEEEVNNVGLMMAGVKLTM